MSKYSELWMWQIGIPRIEQILDSSVTGDQKVMLIREEIKEWREGSA